MTFKMFLLLLFVLYSNAERLCIPIAENCLDGYIDEFGEPIQPINCREISVKQNFIYSRTCSEQFNIIPTIFISDILSFTIENGALDNGEILIFEEYSTVLIRGDYSIFSSDNIHLHKYCQLTFDNALTLINANIILQNSQVFTVKETLTINNSNLTIHDAQIVIENVSTGKLISYNSTIHMLENSFFYISQIKLTQSTLFTLNSPGIRQLTSLILINSYFLNTDGDLLFNNAYLELYDNSILTLRHGKLLCFRSNVTIYNSSTIFLEEQASISNAIYFNAFGTSSVIIGENSKMHTSKSLCLYNSSRLLMKDNSQVTSSTGLQLNDDSIMEVSHHCYFTTPKVILKNRTKILLEDSYFISQKSGQIILFNDSQLLFNNVIISTEPLMNVILYNSSIFRIKSSSSLFESLSIYDNSALFLSDSSISLNSIEGHNKGIIDSKHNSIRSTFVIISDSFQLLLVDTNFIGIDTFKSFQNSFISMKDSSTEILSQCVIHTKSPISIEESFFIVGVKNDYLSQSILDIQENIHFIISTLKSSELWRLYNTKLIVTSILIDYTFDYCFEFIISSSTISDTFIETNHLKLINNKKRIRYCPNVIFNKHVICTLNGTYWKNSYDYQLEYPFTQIDCPCFGSDCSINTSVKELYFPNVPITTKINNFITNLYFEENDNLISITCQSQIAHFPGMVSFQSNSTDLVIQQITHDQNGYYILLDDTVSFPSYEKTLLTTSTFSVSGMSFTLYTKESFIIYMGDLFTNYVLDINSIFPILLLSLNGYKTTDSDSFCLFGISKNNQNICLRKASIQCPSFTYPNSDFTSCLPCVDVHCKWCNNKMCFVCADDYLLSTDGICVMLNDKSHSTNNHLVYCEQGRVLNNMCIDYDSNDPCVLSYESKCYQCNGNLHYILNDNSCSVAEHSLIVRTNSIIQCDDGYYELNGVCISCKQFGNQCSQCSATKCERCSDGTPLQKDGTCRIPYCQKQENGKCSICVDNYSTNSIGYCEEKIENCQIRAISTKECIICQPGFVLLNGQCYKSIQNCETNTQVGCLRCENSYYASEGVCKPCDSNCRTCLLEKNKCFSCDSGYYLTNHMCETDSIISERCAFYSINGKCVKCKNGYYRDGVSCINCDISCSTCNNANGCLTCNSTNFKNRDKVCVPKSTIQGCAVEITEKGCSKCTEGYYLNNNICENCLDSCISCTDKFTCNKCANETVWYSGRCIYYSKIPYCIKAENSRCTKCSFGHTVIDDTYCSNFSLPLWTLALIIIGIICCLGVFTSIIVSLTLLRFRILKKNKLKYTLENMPKTKVLQYHLDNFIVCDLNEINFDSFNNPIPVRNISFESIHIGNSGKYPIIVQPIPITNNKYKIKFKPEVVNLKPKKMCKIKVYIFPFCTLEEESTINVRVNEKTIYKSKCCSIKLSFITQHSCYINGDDLKQFEQIGEGSTGIVYKGLYKRHQVAIKKIKNIFLDVNETEQFHKETQLLNQFRCDYIVYFYGSVINPSNFMFVTELAPYGSFHNLIVNQPDTFNKKFKYKCLLDTAHGIQYLHSNGILHRDIKSDNILLFSLEEILPINAKLTDFGSSRSINMLLTNLTFTKGIGTPAYTAPEILNSKSYKKPADIFAFAITMYEILNWKTPYDTPQFEYSWSIAEFITNGKRLLKTDKINNEEYKLIQRCWADEPNKRMTVEEIISQLQKLYSN
ncbi:tyrosine kinase, putative [Entamoeba histolytica HM-1:IMSS-B]|uniref:Tyrosine kinase, putative n=6 Tax=Entamoeba histolytica TaxID=5759 RepID=C4M2D7_ENTH1|nr:tyrosine kinase, putative [Entamoeba histolytica HM-1:IMSS]EMD48572.1 serine/threonine kinase, putative [Entamoeba histolytica KU27]EMH72192.1 tyrosine kinase, putative [Entamoeba histolytica HM-1:IMSS-B]EMS14633.1 serine/threonine kinase, putative [Entamoeba histolytica HM-3:IMSS]ENY60939.1 protein serine/threonine kinase, putative [Entamoeba histolytica HM-1:IMSS-A]GAT95439.1 tyrosine kinase putative [Entamoeba histolytica]|eukprot:XP_650815.2 tyrosine kinase, putative [Entamoeba histolytica HM-1:IMSS]